MYLKRKFALIFLLSLISLSIKGETSFSVSPLSINFKIPQGKTKKSIITIINESNKPLRVIIKLEDWSYGKEGTLILPESDSYSHSCKSWIKLNVKELKLTSKEKIIKYSISVPKETTPGDYWTAISFETQPYKDTSEPLNALLIKHKIITGIYVRVGKAKPEAEITDLEIKENQEGLTAILTVKNKGSFIFPTKGKLEIKDEKGKKLLKLELPEENILPMSERNLILYINKKLPSGNYFVYCELELPPSKNVEFRKNLFLEGDNNPVQN